MKNEICIGIDFGAMNSCCSYYNTEVGKVDVIPNNLGYFTTPTMIWFSKDSDEILYGNVVQDLLNSNNNGEYLENIFTNIKRLLGISYSSFIENTDLNMWFKRNNIINQNNVLTFKVLYNNTDHFFTVNDLIKLYLKFLKNTCENFIGKSINDCCITIPVYFNDSQREILKNCCSNVNLNVIRILNEPTAAALSYAFNNAKELDSEYALIIDSGCSTTDISLLHMDYIESVYEVKNTAGDNFLGGEDITNEISKYIITQVKNKIPKSFQTESVSADILTKKQLNKIKTEAENAKKILSFNSSVKLLFEIGDTDIIVNLSNLQFNEITKEWFRKAKNLIYYVIDGHIQQDVNFSISNINNIIFIGGTTKIPYLKQMINKMFGDEMIINNIIDPDQTVSIGAALQGALINNLIDDSIGGDTLLLDTIPLNIGIEIYGGLMHPIISRNTMIPANCSSSFTNSEAFDDTIIINIYRGQRKFVKDNELIGTFELKNDILSKYDKGKIDITIIFNIDSNSIITAKAKAKVGDVLVVNEIIVTKQSILSTNLSDILLNADANKLIDSELANKILAKMELYDSFKHLLAIFHQKCEERDLFLISELNILFNNTFNVIKTFEDYTDLELKILKKNFESKWHELLFGGSLILKDENNLIIDYGGSSIE